MAKNFIIIGLLFLCVWMGSRIVVLDNYSYAARLNNCSEYLTPEYATPDYLLRRHYCLNETKARTNWMWNLAYGLNIL
mgnify:FL=1